MHTRVAGRHPVRHAREKEERRKINDNSQNLTLNRDLQLADSPTTNLEVQRSHRIIDNRAELCQVASRSVIGVLDDIIAQKSGTLGGTTL